MGTPERFISARAATLSPMARICAAVGPMNVQPGGLHGGGEVGVLGEEAVAGVDRLGPRDARDADDLVAVQVGLARRRRPDADASVGSRTCSAWRSASE
jgi:hypothetical protein